MPPNGSVVSVGSVAVFARINPCTLEEIAVNEILVRKDEHEAHGSKIYVANCAAATKGLPVKFLGSFHLLLKKGQEYSRPICWQSRGDGSNCSAYQAI